MNKPFYITTTLPYVNAPLHMGHALEFVRADTLARYKQLQGYDVYFNTGTDEHGQKIAQKAIEAGTTPQEFVDAGFATFKTQVASFGISPDVHYVRTTDGHHVSAAQEFWKRVSDNGYIYKKNYQAKYCVGCEEVKTDSDLAGGECPLHPGTVLELIDEENYFFKLSALQDKLLALYASRIDFVVPAFRYNEIKAFVERGLEDFSISRLKSKMSWGVPVPGDEDHVMYVWFDALTNYISTLGWPEDTGTFEKYWVTGTPTQYCGKDNTRFQSLTWQAMLLAAEVPNSYQIVVNGFITGDGGVRMSKTLGNVVDPLAIAEEYGTDALRMFLLKEISSFEDSPFTIERFRDSYNAHLANGLGNLTSRILTLSEKYCDPFEGLPETKLGEDVEKAVAGFDLQRAMQIVWEAIGQLDAQIQQEEPFKVVKVDEEAGKDMISRHVRTLYTIAESLAAFMPTTSASIIDLIRQNKKPETPLFIRI
ncbi:MAG: methionine--tRNA ligase [Candidatus Pacebacteria bacterium]|nr:methionine--tRNA ligase [Candidatus Paceibacterota bacterium]